MRVSSGLHVNDTALGGKLGLLAGGRGREGNADFQLAAEFERVACGKRHTAPAEIYAGSMLLERQTQAVNATNQHREIYRDSAFPSALQGRGRSAGKAHPFPPSFFWGPPLLPPRRDRGKQVQPPRNYGLLVAAVTFLSKNVSTRSKISAVVRAVCTFRRNSAPFLTPCVK